MTSTATHTPTHGTDAGTDGDRHSRRRPPRDADGDAAPPTRPPTETPTATHTPTRNADADRDRHGDADRDAHADATATETATSTPTETPTETGEPDAGAPTVTPSASVSPVGTVTPTPTATVVTVRLNEILPNPLFVNWDGQGKATAQDEWIELYNPTRRAVDLTGWSITVQVPGKRLSQTYRFGRRMTLAASGYLVLYQRDTRLVLDDLTATVWLLDAGGHVVDSVTYEGSILMRASAGARTVVGMPAGSPRRARRTRRRRLH